MPRFTANLTKLSEIMYLRRFTMAKMTYYEVGQKVQTYS